MSEPDLFLDAHSLSPRLAWLKQHNLTTVEEQLPRPGIGPRNAMPWCCHNKAKTVAIFGEDEAEATLKYAEIMGLKHWMLADMTEPAQQTEEW